MSTARSPRASWNDRLMFNHDCEGCGEKIKKSQTHFQVTLGTFGDVLLPLGHVYYYHEPCFEPYMVVLWLQEGQAVAISKHED